MRTFRRGGEGFEEDDHGGHVVAALAVAGGVGSQTLVAQLLAHVPGGLPVRQPLAHKRHRLRTRSAGQAQLHAWVSGACENMLQAFCMLHAF